MTKAKPCPACGAEGTVERRARKGRHRTYRGVDVELPATLKLTDCSACNELWLDDAESDAYSAAIDEWTLKTVDERVAALLTHLPKKETP